MGVSFVDGKPPMGGSRTRRHILGPLVECLEYGYTFVLVIFSSGTLPTKKGVRKGT